MDPDQYPVTRFHALTIGRLVALLDRLEFQYSISFIPIESEFGSYFIVRPGGLTFYIYENGAEVSGHSIDDRFEWQDYRNNLDKLVDEFLSSAEGHLRTLKLERPS